MTGIFRQVNTIYEASPECLQRECVVFWREDREALKGYYQHGDNPEAVLEVPLVFFGTAKEAAESVRTRYREWSERIHEYESSGPIIGPH